MTAHPIKLQASAGQHLLLQTIHLIHRQRQMLMQPVSPAAYGHFGLLRIITAALQSVPMLLTQAAKTPHRLIHPRIGRFRKRWMNPLRPRQR